MQNTETVLNYSFVIEKLRHGNSAKEIIGNGREDLSESFVITRTDVIVELLPVVIEDLIDIVVYSFVASEQVLQFEDQPLWSPTEFTLHDLDVLLTFLHVFFILERQRIFRIDCNKRVTVAVRVNGHFYLSSQSQVLYL
jgi:hypothetical protein